MPQKMTWCGLGTFLHHHLKHTKEDLKENIAYQAMARIGILYKVEELIKNKTPDEKYEERQKQSKPGRYRKAASMVSRYSR